MGPRSESVACTAAREEICCAVGGETGTANCIAAIEDGDGARGDAMTGGAGGSDFQINGSAIRSGSVL